MNIVDTKIFRKIGIILIVVFLFFFYLYPLQAEGSSSPSMVFNAPYDNIAEEREWKYESGAVESTAKANTKTGFMGVFGQGYIGGASSEAGLKKIKIFAPEAMHLKVTAKIHYMGGISGFGLAECSGFVFKWKVNNGEYHERKMEGGLTREWVAKKTLQVASLATSMINVPAELEAIDSLFKLMEVLDYLNTLGEFFSVTNEIEKSLDDAKTETISFDFDARKGWNEITIVIRGGVGAFFTGSGMYMVIGYLESLRIEGLRYPNLQVKNMSIEPVTSSEAKLYVDIANNGGWAIPGDLSVYIGTKILKKHVPRLAPGDSQTIEFDFILPEETTVIRAGLKNPSDIPELSSIDNVREITYYYRLPDLSFLQEMNIHSSYRVGEVVENTSVQATFSVGKKGWLPVENAKLLVKIPEANWQKEVTHNFAGGDNSHTYTHTCTIDLPRLNVPSGLPRKVYHIEAFLDPDNTIEESNEGNNQASESIMVISSAPPAPGEEVVCPDLYFPQAINILPSAKIVEGESAQIEVFVGNRNNSPPAENVKLLLKIPLAQWEQEVVFDSLAGNSSQSRVIELPVFHVLQGGRTWYEVEAVLDPNYMIEEDKLNNRASASIEVMTQAYAERITWRQLKTISVSIHPSSVTHEYFEDQVVTLQGEIQNIGERDLEDVTVGFFSCEDEPYCKQLREIGKKQVSIIKSQTNETASLSWKVKKPEARSTMRIYCIVDPDNIIDEQNESEDIHRADISIVVRKKEEPAGEKPQGDVDVVIEDNGLFLEKPRLRDNEYLSVKVYNRGSRDASAEITCDVSWIGTDHQGRKQAISKRFPDIKADIGASRDKVIKIYFKNLNDQRFIQSNHVKFRVEAFASGEKNSSNNRAFLRIGDFDKIAQELQHGGGTEIEQKPSIPGKPDLAVTHIKNTEPPLKVGTKRVFTVVVRNVSQLDAENIIMDCVVRPKGSGRPHPELGWKKFRKVVPKIKAGSESSLSIEYTPIRKGVYEIVASVGSVKWQGMQTSDADQSNNHMMTYFGIETPVDAETGGESAPSGVDLDLAATDIWIDNKTPNVGEVISGGFVVHNYSPVALKNIEWKVYSDANEVAAGTITEIGSGASYTVNASSEADQEGTFSIKAIVDPNNKIPETNENNNTITKQLAITSTSQPISLPKVDVAIASVSLSNAHIKVGQDTKVQATVKNLGSDTVNAVPVAFLVGDVNFSIKVIDSLAPGETKTVTAPLIGLMGGTYTITVIADRRELIKEVNEQNNRGTATLVVERLIKWQ